MEEEDDDKRLLELELRGVVVGTPDDGFELELGLGLLVGTY